MIWVDQWACLKTKILDLLFVGKAAVVMTVNPEMWSLCHDATDSIRLFFDRHLYVMFLEPSMSLAKVVDVVELPRFREW